MFTQSSLQAFRMVCVFEHSTLNGDFFYVLFESLLTVFREPWSCPHWTRFCTMNPCGRLHTPSTLNISWTKMANSGKDRLSSLFLQVGHKQWSNWGKGFKCNFSVSVLPDLTRPLVSLFNILRKARVSRGTAGQDGAVPLLYLPPSEVFFLGAWRRAAQSGFPVRSRTLPQTLPHTCHTAIKSGFNQLTTNSPSL